MGRYDRYKVVGPLCMAENKWVTGVISPRNQRSHGTLLITGGFGAYFAAVLLGFYVANVAEACASL